MVAGAHQAVDIEEIYKGGKSKHFKSIHAATGIPYEDMIFFGPRLALSVPGCGFRACFSGGLHEGSGFGGHRVQSGVVR